MKPIIHVNFSSKALLHNDIEYEQNKEVPVGHMNSGRSSICR